MLLPSFNHIFNNSVVFTDIMQMAKCVDNCSNYLQKVTFVISSKLFSQ